MRLTDLSPVPPVRLPLIAVPIFLFFCQNVSFDPIIVIMFFKNLQVLYQGAVFITSL